MLKYSRRWKKEEKARILLKNSDAGVSLSELARKYQVSPQKQLKKRTMCGLRKS